MSQVSIALGAAGFYKIEALRVDGDGNEVPGSRRVAADWFPNLITNFGLNGMMDNSPGDCIPSCFVGSGSTTPAFTDTALVSQVASTSTYHSHLIGFTSIVPYYGWRRMTYRFNTGVAAGNLSEVGVGIGSNSLFSRALIVDGSGNPTTITVLSDEVLDVTYELRIYVPTSDTIVNVTEDSVNYKLTIRAANAGTNTWCGQSADAGGIGKKWDSLHFQPFPASSTLGAITGQPSGSGGSQLTVKNMWTGTASGGSRTMTFSFSISAANVTGGIGAFTIGDTGSGFYCSWMFQVGCSPALPKDGTKTMSIDFTMSLSRVTP